MVALCVCAVVGTILLADRLLRNSASPSLSPSLSVPWAVSTTLHHPSETRHILFVKTHKAASSTVFNILIRFSISRQLHVMFPRDGHLLSEKSPLMGPLVDHPPPPFLFDILCNHVVFVEALLRRQFPKDTFYFTILRDPLSQVQSAYDYYRTKYQEAYLMQSSSFEEFLTNVQRYEPQNPYISFTNNRMSLDLGLPSYQLHNISHIPTFLQHVSDVFHLVLITERFDESMILLKRRLKWTTKDVLYTKINQREVAGSLSDSKPQRKIDPSVEAVFKRVDQFDVALYDHFSQVFNLLVVAEGPDFQEEVETFQGIVEMVRSFCEGYADSKGQLTVQEHRWNERFVLDSAECESISLEDLTLNTRAKYLQQLRMGAML